MDVLKIQPHFKGCIIIHAAHRTVILYEKLKFVPQTIHFNCERFHLALMRAMQISKDCPAPQEKEGQKSGSI